MARGKASDPAASSWRLADSRGGETMRASADPVNSAHSMKPEAPTILMAEGKPDSAEAGLEVNASAGR